MGVESFAFVDGFFSGNLNAPDRSRSELAGIVLWVTRTEQIAQIGRNNLFYFSWKHFVPKSTSEQANFVKLFIKNDLTKCENFRLCKENILWL